MRHRGTFLGALVAVGCGNATPLSAISDNVADLALAELRSDPGSFYVDFHSDLCPGGFARGFLP